MLPPYLLYCHCKLEICQFSTPLSWIPLYIRIQIAGAMNDNIDSMSGLDPTKTLVHIIIHYIFYVWCATQVPGIATKYAEAVCKLEPSQVRKICWCSCFVVVDKLLIGCWIFGHSLIESIGRFSFVKQDSCFPLTEENLPVVLVLIWIATCMSVIASEMLTP